jgi:hypothetical protein
MNHKPILCKRSNLLSRPLIQLLCRMARSVSALVDFPSQMPLYAPLGYRSRDRKAVRRPVVYSSQAPVPTRCWPLSPHMMM